MSRRTIDPPALFQRVVGGHKLYAYVQAVSGGELLFISGLLSRNQAGEIVGVGDMGAQIAQIGENLTACLAAAGATLADLVKTTTYVTDIDAFFAHADVRMRYFGPALPASTTVEVRRLSHPDFLVEIEAVAHLNGSPPTV
jgi:enamine deaminase RidA (YjgF/YER057c/UK114 family)